MPDSKQLVRIVSLVLVIFIAVSCTAKPRRRIVEEPPPESSQPLDPMVTATDREVVPEVYPIHIVPGEDTGDSLITPRPIDYSEFDSTLNLVNPTEVYRVQIFTSRLFAEASREQAIANEIFNQPVHLDYEVPYYKLRVGDFVTREEAEDMVSEIRSIGYRGAWVARVVLRVREALIFDEGDEPILPSEVPDTVYLEPEVIDSVNIEESGDEGY